MMVDRVTPCRLTCNCANAVYTCLSISIALTDLFMPLLSIDVDRRQLVVIRAERRRVGRRLLVQEDCEQVLLSGSVLCCVVDGRRIRDDVVRPSGTRNETK